MLTIENWRIQEETGYKPITTFYTDFSIAEGFGVSAIRDMYRQAFEEWKGHYKYITELAMVLNWKCWRWWEMKRSLGELYKSLYIELDSWIHENFTGEEISYYYEVTD